MSSETPKVFDHTLISPFRGEQTIHESLALGAQRLTTRYLRTREDFFARQIGKVPSAAPESLQLEGPAIQVVYNDGLRVMATVVSLSAFLCLRSYIFDLVALELHLLINKGHHKVVSEILFGTD